MIQIPILLLAAGQSSRMRGADKLMQEIDGVPLLRRSALTAMAAGPVIVALPPRPHPRYEALTGLDVQIAPIPDAAEGMNASLRGALALVSLDAPAAMIMLADLPDLTPDDLKVVLRARERNPDHLIWRGATQSGKPGHPVLFDQSLFATLSQLTGDTGAQSVIRSNGARLCLVPLPGRNALYDLDTPEDWTNWRKGREGRTQPPK